MYSTVFTVPLKVTTVPPKGTVKVKVEEGYLISCNVTGDDAPTNPWLHDSKEVENNTAAGIEVITVPLKSTTGITSTINFTKVTAKQFGAYTCDAGDGKTHVTVTLEEAGKWNAQCGYTV